MEQILSIENLSIALPRGADRGFAVDGVTLQVARGEILCVVGESGSGKSVLASAAMGALAPGLRRTGGRLTFQGQEVTDLPEKAWQKIRGNRIAMIFQEPMAALNPAIPVGAQVAEVLELHGDLDRAGRAARVLALLDATHLPDPPRIAASFPHQLSGGQCQRVVIAMALAMNPALLIADEPTTALDVTTQAQVLRLIGELRDNFGHGILFITHDFGVVAEIADRVAVMRHGRLVEIGPADQVLNRPQDSYTRMLIDAVPDLHRQVQRPSRQAEPALRIEGLAKTYGTLQALKPVNLTLRRGRTVAIVGESGSGKSTLAKTVIRLQSCSAGRVLVDGQDFAALSGRALARARRRIQMIFQDPFGSLNPRRRVGDIVGRAAVLAGMTRAEARARAAELMELVGLKREALDRRPGQFSGGQRQRIGIARALAMSPEIVIADESVSALDVSVQKQVLALIDDLQQRLGLTVMFITHDLRVAAQIADYIAVMRQGEVVEFGEAEALLAAPRHDYTRALLDAAPGRHWSPPRLAREA
jgi:peptide/nickel transport system ATP-binding protein